MPKGADGRKFDRRNYAKARAGCRIEGRHVHRREYYDAWIIIPSVDTRISFSGPPNQNTPFLGAGQAMNFNLRARKVYYIAALPSLTGTLSIWLAKYAEG